MPALKRSPGGPASLSSATITRLTKQWADDHAAFQDRDLSDWEPVYARADGVHPKVATRPGALVHPGPARCPVGRHEGTDRPGEGLRESTEPWADLLRDWKPACGPGCTRLL
ncbi:hypothetical protein Kpho02_38540 [Kitasatospora phosalacinea]|uniref:Uncharacterized protein n=1 Tax=Kitasatospora phosalacinea TaxID=2065 RepID=A0A9W6V3Y3_9ACTN|nr:hypothetical protein Kpho02_38540 [Kitasatospora phosalacinea]